MDDLYRYMKGCCMALILLPTLGATGCSGGSGLNLSGLFEFKPDKATSAPTIDTTPAPTPPAPDCNSTQRFIFQPVEAAELNQFYVSQEVQAGRLCPDRQIGIGAPEGVYAQYSLDGGPWRSDITEIISRQRIRIRVRAAPTYDTPRHATLTIGEPECITLITAECDWVLTGGFSEFKVTTRQGRPEDAPRVEITYPPHSIEVNDNTLAVMGTAHDPDGVFEILVNGVPAVSHDGFMTWSAEVPLRNGLNTLKVASADSLLNRNPEADSVVVENFGVAFHSAENLFLAEASETLYVLGLEADQVIAIDLNSDDWWLVSAGANSPYSFEDPRSLAVDEASGRAWVLDQAHNDIIEIDLASGERSLLSEREASDAFARDLVFDPKRKRLLLLETDPGQMTATTASSGRVIAIDPLSGERERVSDNTAPEGEPEFFLTYSMVFDEALDRLLLMQRNSVISVHPRTGKRSLILAERALQAIDAALDSEGRQLITGSSPGYSPVRQLERLDLDRGELTPIDTDELSIPQGSDLVYDSVRNRLLFVKGGHVGAVDLTSGEVIQWLY